ncbi:MAG: PAS domain S-box protein, partial [Desulfobacterales bacterium]|nr:PAS domain S-box protein [Desulfobacterales bacterium]
MSEKPSYEELEEKIRELEEERIAFSRKIRPQPGNKSSFSQLFQWAPIPMAYATEKDGYSGSIWNAAWYKTFGYPESLAHGRSGKEIGLWFRSEDRTRLIEMANRQNYVTDFETVLKCYNGDLRQCSLFGRFINNPGNRLLMVVYHDITEQKKAEEERKKLQEQLNQAQKMESMGRLAGGMAHEINNPLAGILQNASVLENRLTDHRMTANVNAAQSVGTTINTIAAFMDQREIPRLIRNIKDPGTRVASIVENMLSFARKSDASFSTHDPAVLMDKVLVLAETDYDLKNHNDFKSIALEKR